jgi:hypothetical protein
LIGHSAEFEKRTGVHFRHRPAAMHLHRGFGDADVASDLFAQATAHDLDHDFALPGLRASKRFLKTAKALSLALHKHLVDAGYENLISRCVQHRK